MVKNVKKIKLPVTRKDTQRFKILIVRNMPFSLSETSRLDNKTKKKETLSDFIENIKFLGLQAFVRPKDKPFPYQNLKFYFIIIFDLSL